jgi:hypothetical protein
MSWLAFSNRNLNTILVVVYYVYLDIFVIYMGNSFFLNMARIFLTHGENLFMRFIKVVILSVAYKRERERERERKKLRADDKCTIM